MSIPDLEPATANRPPSGCVRCTRDWPNAAFNQFNEAVARGETPEYVCDLCLEFPILEVESAIDEAQGVKPEAQRVVREVVVTGITSRKNIIGWRYVTVRGVALAFTDLTVEFKGPKLYRYLNVPVAVCEALIGATSVGSFFSEQIEHSYQCQKL